MRPASGAARHSALRRGCCGSSGERPRPTSRLISRQLQECRNNFEQCPAPAARFSSIIDEIKARSGRARIETVNRLINASVRYMSDLAQHGVLDRWTAPLATLAAGQGDCEDYAIAKYVAEVGVEAADLRFLLVRDRLGPASGPRTERRAPRGHGDAEDYSAFEEAIAARAVCCGGCGGRPMTLASSLPIICGWVCKSAQLQWHGAFCV